MKRCPFSVFFAFLISLLVLVPLASEQNVWGQLSEIENQIPKNVPVKVEFKNYESEKWVHDLEIEVTNTGKKPIYYLKMILWLDVTNPVSGRQRAFSFKFGDIRKFYSIDNGETAGPDDPAILPNESYTFKIDPGSVKGFDMGKKRSDFIEPRTANFEHSFTSFGDGTGILKGGTPFQQKKKRYSKVISTHNTPRTREAPF